MAAKRRRRRPPSLAKEEESSDVSIVVEGTLPGEVVDTIVDDARRKLGELEGVRYTKQRLT